jgi:hypothetical protein
MSVVSMSLRMNESMAGGWTATGNNYDGTGNANTQMLTLTNLLDQGNVSGSTYFASAFLNNSTAIWGTMMSAMGSGTGYATDPVPYDTQMTSMMNTISDGTENAFYKLPFMVDGSGDVVTGSWMALTQGANSPGSTSTWAAADEWVNQNMMYGDCTLGSLMGGNSCMAGDDTAASMMKGSNYSLAISQVAAVPVPGAVWLFGGALLSLFGANRRKSVLPA